MCLYSDDAKLPEHLVAEFSVPKPLPKPKLKPAAAATAAATDTSLSTAFSAAAAAGAAAAKGQAPGGAKKGRHRGKKGADDEAGKTVAGDEAGMERLHALAFAAAMCSPLAGPPKPRKAAQGLGPYADSDYSSLASSGSEGEEEGGDDGLWWGDGGMKGEEGEGDERVVVMLAGKGAVAVGSPETPVEVCKPESMEI